MNTEKLVSALGDLDDATRRDALSRLAATSSFPEPGALFNMHCHSFFSYHAQGWSPARIAYTCRLQGLCAAGLCDFDVLDGMDEFLWAGRLLRLRVAAHLETRAYVRELADVDISSPGEAGVTYIMGCGFVREPAAESAESRELARLRQGAKARNMALIARVNDTLPAIAIDYDRDVLPLTPRGVATERHIVRAYCSQARLVFPDQAARAAFWAPLLRCDFSTFVEREAQAPRFEDQVRNALAKRGGIGYIQPDEQTFPPAAEFVAWARACGAIPTIAWLDGTSGGESDCDRLLDLMTGMGCAALNIIPDRNWNLNPPDEAARKRARLDEVVAACVRRGLPINIGTEMNKDGLPFVDDLAVAALRPHARVFTEGMRIMIGQSILSRYADMPYAGARAAAAFPEVKARNAFFAAVGALPPLDATLAESLIEAGPDLAFARLADKAAS